MFGQQRGFRAGERRDRAERGRTVLQAGWPGEGEESESGHYDLGLNPVPVHAAQSGLCQAVQTAIAYYCSCPLAPAGGLPAPTQARIGLLILCCHQYYPFMLSESSSVSYFKYDMQTLGMPLHINKRSFIICYNGLERHPTTTYSKLFNMFSWFHSLQIHNLHHWLFCFFYIKWKILSKHPSSKPLQNMPLLQLARAMFFKLWVGTHQVYWEPISSGLQSTQISY